MNFSDWRLTPTQMNSALELANIEGRTRCYSLLMAGMCIAVASLSSMFKNRKPVIPKPSVSLEKSHITLLRSSLSLPQRTMDR